MAARDAGHWSPTRLKSPVAARVSPDSAAAPELVTVRVCTADAVLTATLPKVIWVGLGAMPPTQYERLHHESAVTPEQLATLKKYALSLVPDKTATAEEVKAADDEYAHWIASGNAAATNVSPAPNGMAFLPDYKNWRAISSTQRGDNYTLRQILGNDIAIKAVAENHINPWPDGAAFAKLAWLEQTDEKGMVKTGKFVQVEFMVRDSQKYATTLGWGFARWRGTDLKPYGKDANFAGECVGCHRPLVNSNYVFTQPLGAQR